MAKAISKFKAGQLYELSRLFTELYSPSKINLRQYVKTRIEELENQTEMLGSAHSARRRAPSQEYTNGRTFLDDED